MDKSAILLAEQSQRSHHNNLNDFVRNFRAVKYHVIRVCSKCTYLVFLVTTSNKKCIYFIFCTKNNTCGIGACARYNFLVSCGMMVIVSPPLPPWRERPNPCLPPPLRVLNTDQPSNNYKSKYHARANHCANHGISDHHLRGIRSANNREPNSHAIDGKSKCYSESDNGTSKPLRAQMCNSRGDPEFLTTGWDSFLVS
jgi:hypothetical protein